MKVLILASGIGKRLYPLTKGMPKPLVKIHGKEILRYQIENLIECGLTDLLITTGPFSNKIKEFVKKNYPEMHVSYIKNPKYESTNYIYSMWLTKKFIDDDIILLHSDLLFEKKLLEKIINTDGNRVLVNKKIKPNEKDFKAVIENGRVVKIGVNFFGNNAFASFPLYKFFKKDFLLWINECEKYIEKKEVEIYAEDILNMLSDSILLYPTYFYNEMCMEIDTRDDIKIAETILEHKKT
ncbi:MAG TPA: phosphocholine cytidylyltransferase family protein [Candidatus Atribacteria bacterium]|nr:phosphocholine cytidylyltransferase family protein [Candidatus Atribacteria bacterium]